MAEITGGRRAALVAAACAVPRLAFLTIQGADDTGVYPWTLSSALLETGGFQYDGQPTGAFEPLHPFVLALVRFIVGDNDVAVACVQIGIACVAAVLLDRLARTVTGSSRAGWIAAFAYASSPYLIRQASAWLEVTLLTAVMTAGWLAWSRGRMTSAVAWFSVGTLVRAAVFPIAVCAVFLAFRHQRRAGATTAIVMLLILAPWAVRNTVVGGTPWPDRQAWILWAGNNAWTSAIVPRHDMDLFKDQSDVLVPDGRYGAAAWRYVASAPVDFVRTKLRNAWHFLSPRLIPYQPQAEDSQIILHPDGAVTTVAPRLRSPTWIALHDSWTTIFLVLAVVGLAQRRTHWRGDALLLASIAVFWTVAVMYYPTTRLRTAIDPVLMVYAGSAVAQRQRRLA